MIEEGCVVEVVQSRSGYTGTGTAIAIAFHDYWLVQLPNPKPNQNAIILVKATNLRFVSPPSVKEKKKKNQE
jgi:hypothetical protein